MKEHYNKSNLKLILVCIALCCFVAGFMYNIYNYMQDQEDRSRDVQIHEVTERISQITDTIIKQRLSYVKTYAGLFKIEEGATKEDVIRELYSLNAGIIDEDLFLGVVDDRGHFYTSEGRSGRWKDFTMLIKRAPRDQVAITKLTGHGHQEYMVFLHRLDVSQKFAKGKIKYFGIAMNMSQLHTSLVSNEFEKDMVTFIVNHKGQRIYQQGNDSNKLDAYNLFDSLGKNKVVRGDSISELRNKLLKNQEGLTELEINGKTYAVCSVPMYAAPWSVLVVLPKVVLSGETGLISGLVWRLTVIGLAILVLGILVMLQRGHKEKQQILEQALIDAEKANEALEESAAENEAQLEEITAAKDELEKTHAALEVAKREAEAANKAKTMFLNNMSHDIRTPMNAILGFAKLMEKELNNPKVVAEHLKKIHYSGEYLLTIINNILDMARIESGRTTVDEELIDLQESQGAVVAVFEADAKKKDINLNVHWSIQHRYVYADYPKCQQIAVNLISNAIKYTPNGGFVNVTVEELTGKKQGYTSFCFTVADTGIGMSKEYQEELFEAFSRERNTTHSKVVGTGLGMAIVKKLVDLLEGTITVDSEPGRGSIFKVVLQLRIGEAPEKYVSRHEEAVLAEVDFSGKRILLAEDNELNAEIAIAILEEDGFVIEHAEDGVACVDMFNRKPAGYYDLILMDIQMPNLNGYEAANKIRKFADKAKASIPILAMTANAFDEDKEKALAAGMDGFCTKPIDIEQLQKELVRVLK